MVKDLPNHADDNGAPVVSIRREQSGEFRYLGVPGHGGRAHQAEQRDRWIGAAHLSLTLGGDDSLDLVLI